MMRLHEYLKPEGAFDHERYGAVQEEGNRRELHACWVRQRTLEFLAT